MFVLIKRGDLDAETQKKDIVRDTGRRPPSISHEMTEATRWLLAPPEGAATPQVQSSTVLNI